MQEAQGRWPAFQARYDGIELHLIGPASDQQGPRPRSRCSTPSTRWTARSLPRRSRGWRRNAGKAPRSSCRSTPGRNRKKAGCLPADVDAFVAELRALDLPLRGLMCIPRPSRRRRACIFALLAKMAERNGLSGLSMGMSADFEKAISFGATHVRVGSANFRRTGCRQGLTPGCSRLPLGHDQARARSRSAPVIRRRSPGASATQPSVGRPGPRQRCRKDRRSPPPFRTRPVPVPSAGSGHRAGRPATAARPRPDRARAPSGCNPRAADRRTTCPPARSETRPVAGAGHPVRAVEGSR